MDIFKDEQYPECFYLMNDGNVLIQYSHGILIVKRMAYGFNQDSKRIDFTPAYWIDMSKLFELYIFKLIWLFSILDSSI